MLNENRIEVIPPDLLALGKLKTLWLNGNSIQRVQNLRSSRQLVHLDLSRNHLTGSVSEVTQLMWTSTSAADTVTLPGTRLPREPRISQS